MQFKNLAFSAFAATALAQSVTQNEEDLISILNVLQTALPSSLVQEAITNSAAVSSQIAAQFSAGSTPAWFTGLPSDIQTYLVPQVTGGVLGSNGTSAVNGTIISSNSTANATAGTTTTSTRMTITSDSSSATGGSNSGSSGSDADSDSAEDSSASESGNAAAPTAIIGAGLAGAVGLVGLLAL